MAQDLDDPKNAPLVKKRGKPEHLQIDDVVWVKFRGTPLRDGSLRMRTELRSWCSETANRESG